MRTPKQQIGRIPEGVCTACIPPELNLLVDFSVGSPISFVLLIYERPSNNEPKMFVLKLSRNKHRPSAGVTHHGGRSIGPEVTEVTEMGN
jgi:hypothetical protein